MWNKKYEKSDVRALMRKNNEQCDKKKAIRIIDETNVNIKDTNQGKILSVCVTNVLSLSFYKDKSLFL